jgi:hypothetical protein
MSTALDQEIHDRVSELEPDQKRQVLDYARALSEAPRRGVPGKALLRFAGTIPEDDIAIMEQVIEEECERIDPREW